MKGAKIAPMLSASIAALALMVAAMHDGAALAQQRATSGSGQDATEIVAGQGIEWQRDKKVYVARGGVVVTRGETVLQADNMVAYYRDGGGKSKIFRIDATGRVTVRSRDTVASGDRGVYDLDNKVMTLTGSNLSFVATNSKVTARDSLEYWDEKRMAVARGKALAVHEDDLIRADVLVAYFNGRQTPDDKKAAQGLLPDGAKQKKNEVVRYEGFGNVLVESKDNVARGDHLVYEVKDKIARLTGGAGAPPGATHTPGGPPAPPPAPQGDLSGRVTGTFTPKPGTPKPVDDSKDADKAAPDSAKKKTTQPKDGAATPQQ